MNIIAFYKKYKIGFKNYNDIKKVYKHQIKILIKLIVHSKKAKIILQDNEIHCWSTGAIWFYGSLPNSFVESSNVKEYLDGLKDFLEFNYKNNKIKLYDVLNSGGSFKDIFLYEDHKYLDPENKVVIDIGTNIGDTAIYFALNNAKRVIALEPYPYSYNFALKNIKENNLEEKIILLNVGYGNDEEKNININIIPNGGSSFIESKEGKNIKLYSLKTLINNYKLNNNLLLKMDCEGCEYNLLNEENDVLKKFSKMQIEYHYGYEKLKDKLEMCGFKVNYSIPRESYSNFANRIMIIGYIFAEQK